MKKYCLLVLAVVFIAASVFVVKKYILVSEKDRVLKTMRMAEIFLERKDHVNFMKHLSTEYLDDYGYTWATLFFLVKNILSQYESISISLDRINIEIEEGNAYVNFTGEVQAEKIAAEPLFDTGRFELLMKKEGRRWKITWFGGNPY